MIGAPMPNPRDAVIADINRQMDQFFSSGKTVESVPAGATANVSLLGANPHHDKLRAARDKLAPKVKAQAEAGATAAEAAKALGLHVKRVKLIAQENKLRLADPV